jgi:hypothetical protein
MSNLNSTGRERERKRVDRVGRRQMDIVYLDDERVGEGDGEGSEETTMLVVLV